ncbi:MAG: sugar O-acetyltransferase [Clostridia bacterium]|nr:sugar O-acetyltransferase [Clostridia bacterium]
MTEKGKMLAGKIYDPHDGGLRELSSRAHALCLKYNSTPDTRFKKREKILDKLLPNRGEGTYLQGPVHFDYGVFTTVGKNFYANFNLTVLDTCPVTIGDNVFFGPNVSVLTPLHPLRFEDRNPYTHEKGYITDKEYGAPITIGDNCWIAGNVTILAGAKIGSGCVIGAGSVVSGEIPENTLAYGVPCRLVRKITAKDAISLKKELF